MITLKNVTLRRGAKVLLDGASVTLNPGEKVGLVGRNGAGKSSLFALFNGNLHEDAGEYFIPPQWRMGQVAQDMPETTQSATEFVVEGDTVLLAARQEVTAAEATDDYNRMAHAYTELGDAGEHDAAARPLGSADRALTSAASALLLEGLTPAARHFTPGLHLVGAGTTIGELVPHHSVEEVLFHFDTKDIVGQLD